MRQTTNQMQISSVNAKKAAAQLRNTCYLTEKQKRLQIIRKNREN